MAWLARACIRNWLSSAFTTARPLPWPIWWPDNLPFCPPLSTPSASCSSRGLDLPLKEVRRIATHLGAQVLTGRKRDLLDYRDGRMPVGQELAGKRVACCIDAGKTRLRRATRKQKGKGKNKTQRRRYKTDWRDVKLLIIYEIDAKGEKVRTSRPWIDGTFGGPDEAMELLAMHLHRLGAAQAEVVVFLSDGAPWIWERVEWVAKRVGLRSEQWQFVLDFWHAAQHIGLCWGTCRWRTRNESGCTGSCGSG